MKLAELAEWIAARTGVQVGSLPGEKLEAAVHRIAAKLKIHALDVLAAAQGGNAEVARMLQEVASVGETFFFRNPEQFNLLMTEWLPHWRVTHPGAVQAWSAGTATGEEAWSLAAALHATVRDRGLNVLGTDLNPRSLETAQGGSYGTWSVRQSGPLLLPVVRREGKSYLVAPALRPFVRFAPHNLLEPAPGRFDVIFCRNVLVYFQREAAQRVCAHLLEALEPGGLLVFGVMDGPVVGDEVAALGPPELNCFVYVDKSLPRPRQSSPAPRRISGIIPREPAGPRPPAEDPVVGHLRALELIERGQRAKAERVLVDLQREAPDYLPALLECALLYSRDGSQARAAGLMRELLERSRQLPEAQVVHGPEDLPIAFYRTSAETFLARQRKAQ